MPRFSLATFGALCLLYTAAVAADETLSAPRSVEIGARLGRRAALETRWVTDAGRALRFGSLFDGRRPVFLTLNYTSCRGLCDLQLRGLARGLARLDDGPGDRYRMVTVSIDPEQRGDALRAQARKLAALIGAPAAQWTMLRGTAPEIAALARSVGFAYEYDEATRQYAHAPLLIVLSGDGVVVRYLHGLEYPARDLKLALADAGNREPTGIVESVLLSCFEYDRAAGRYTLAVWRLVRLGGVLTLLALVAGMARFGRRRSRVTQRRPGTGARS